MEPGPTEVAAGVLRVLAPNPGPMTLDGTNTWIVNDPRVDRGPALVVDPGPLCAGHGERVVAALDGRDVAAIVLTHMHADHSEGAWDLAGRLDARVLRAADGSLTDGAALPVGLRVLATPGHTADSVCLISERGPVFTGDSVLGRGTAVVAAPDGALAPYLHSLELLHVLAVAAPDVARPVLPGHGPTREDLAAVVAGYLAHRAQRLEQVRAAVAGGARTAREVVEVVYAEVDPSLWPAAELSAQAQLDWLRERG